jgi:SnoaL-like protein
MSHENVEIVRAFFNAWNARDMDTVRELYDPDVMWRAAEGWPEPGPYIGREAVMRFIGQLKETWDADALEPISFIDGADRIVVRFIWRGVGYGLNRTWSSRASSRFARAGSSPWCSSGTTRKPSKRSGCRTKTFAPTSEPAGYCAGDVGGERGQGAAGDRGVQR